MFSLCVTGEVDAFLCSLDHDSISLTLGLGMMVVVYKRVAALTLVTQECGEHAFSFQPMAIQTLTRSADPEMNS